MKKIDSLTLALALASVLAPPPIVPYGDRPVQKRVTRAERERRKAKKKQAAKSKRRNR
jgi:hypothetical protein